MTDQSGSYLVVREDGYICKLLLAYAEAEGITSFEQQEVLVHWLSKRFLCEKGIGYSPKIFDILLNKIKTGVISEIERRRLFYLSGYALTVARYIFRCYEWQGDDCTFLVETVMELQFPHLGRAPRSSFSLAQGDKAPPPSKGALKRGPDFRGQLNRRLAL